MFVKVCMLVALVVAAVEACPGCPMKMEPDEFKVERLQRVLSMANCRSKIMEIYSVNYQIRSGISYEVVYQSSSGQICTATWLEAPWISKMPVEPKITCTRRTKRSEEETLNPDTVELARKHIGYLLDERSNSLYTQEVTKMDVTHVERYGHGYKIDATVQVAYTDCTKVNGKPSQVCTPQQPEKQQTCNVTLLLVQPQGGRKWYKLDKVECH